MKHGEAEVLRAARLRLGQQADVVVWRNEVGEATYPNAKGSIYTVPYGLCIGASDLVAILAPGGRWMAFECKSTVGRPTEEQIQFLKLVGRMGGFGAILSDPGHIDTALACAREGNARAWSPRVYRVGELAFP